MDYYSLSLKNNTQSRVTMLLEKDFKNFQKTKKFDFLKKTKSTFQKLIAKKWLYYLAMLVVAMILPTIESSVAAAEPEKKIFIATAYYSPLPNQEKYYRGSYEADKKINGNGVTASDGTPVFVGMIAAPKNYSFGTKISLDGLGVVSVHDRGGAIVSAENGVAFDRIDIWMGHGDEGLKRTLEWGRREITGYIVPNNTPTSLDLENIVKNAPQITQVALKKLQELGYPTNGKKFSEIILDFQLEHGIVNSASDAGAGNYGPKTTAKLNELYNAKIKNSSGNTSVKTEKITEKIIVPENSLKAEEMAINFMGTVDYKVKNLQDFLNKKWYQTDNNSGKMDLSTLHALRKYQSDKNIGQTGRIDLKTQITIANDL